MEPIEYCCPRCKGDLADTLEAYFCEECDQSYPIVVGIPDFRVFPDSYIDMEDDREKAQDLAQRSASTDFRGLIEYYWSITPHNHPDLVERYIRHALTGVPRGKRTLDAIEASLPHEVTGAGKRFLEIGCGTGGFLVAARELFGQVVGIDIAFRWLVVARKQLAEQGISAQLVCCCAENLPFRDRQVDLVVAGDVIEHTQTQQELIQESHRVLRNKGVFFTATPNRLSLSREPHVRLWGVGWLPRGLAKRYVLWARGIPYDHIRLLSRFELKRMVRGTSFRNFEIRLPDFSAAEQEGLSGREKRLIAVYHRVKNWPVVRSLLGVLGPVLQLVCIREEGDT